MLVLYPNFMMGAIFGTENAETCHHTAGFKTDTNSILSIQWKLCLQSTVIQGPVVQKPINTNPRLKVNQGVYFYTLRCCSTLIFGKTLHLKWSILKNKNRQKKLSPLKLKI